jgi:Fe2+ transport system protein FeoA
LQDRGLQFKQLNIPKMKLSLLNLPIGQRGIVTKMALKNFIKERLHSLGLIDGVEVTPIKNIPFHGPRIYRFMNTSVAIRGDIARKIYVQKC